MSEVKKLEERIEELESVTYALLGKPKKSTVRDKVDSKEVKEFKANFTQSIQSVIEALIAVKLNTHYLRENQRKIILEAALKFRELLIEVSDKGKG